MSVIVQCIPNFSTQREETGAAIARAIGDAGAKVLDRHWDIDHARTVVTFVGAPEKIRKGMLAGAAKALELIDLREHLGEHPRLGAVDVVPVVPIKNITMEECVELSYAIGNDLSANLKLPVYFYEYSAKSEHRKNLAVVRRGGFEALLGQKLTGEKKPDVGPDEMHPTGGAVVVGARGPLIAFNVNLECNDITCARRIAAKMRAVRNAGQGLPGVKAIGISLNHKSCVQVSTNITLPSLVTIYDVFAFVQKEATSMGIPVKETELVGMIRLEHLTAAVSKAMKFDSKIKAESVLDHQIPNLPPPL